MRLNESTAIILIIVVLFLLCIVYSSMESLIEVQNEKQKIYEYTKYVPEVTDAIPVVTYTNVINSTVIGNNGTARNIYNKSCTNFDCNSKQTYGY